MQPGSKVEYVDAKGDGHRASVTEVTGTGDSLYKIVSLAYGPKDDQVADVPHENDAATDADGKAKGPYWREVGAARKREMIPAEAPPGGGVPSGAPDIILPDPEAEPSYAPPGKRARK